MDNNTKIIIGSGLCGPLLAIYLAQRNYRVKLYEKRRDLRVSEISAGRSINLALSHRGIQALKSAKIFDEIEPYLIPMKGRMIHHKDGEIEFQPYSIHSHEYINSVSRGELNKILMNKAENSGLVEIIFDHSLMEINDNTNELVFDNEVRLPLSNHIFGADGSGSIIRNYIDRKVTSPSFKEYLGHSYKELHIAPGENDDYQLEPHALHIWPRGEFMLIALPNMDKSFTCTLFLPKEGEISFTSLTTGEAINTFFQQYFEDALPMLENFPDIYFDNPTGRLATIYADEWQYDSQYCLIGDAAHAIVPFFGQGMNASFEDCQLLMNYLDILKGEWDGLFTRYNLLRKVDTDAIAKMAIENYIEMRDLVAKKEFINERKIANILSEHYPNYFIPRYNMVSFTSIPYSEVYKRGKIQKGIISQLNVENIDMKRAEKMIHEQLTSIT